MSATKPTTSPEVLRAAALHVTRHGHHQGDFYGDPATTATPACIEGAIGIVVLGRLLDNTWQLVVNPTANKAASLFRAYLAQNGSHQNPAEWNDVPGRTAVEVIAALNAAADHGETHGATTTK